MATKFLLVCLLFSTVRADCTSTYQYNYDGNIVASYEACVAKCDQQSICGSAYFQSTSGACETFDCVDSTSIFPGWTQYAKAGAEKCPNALQTPQAQPASTKLMTVTISDPFGTKCTSAPASTSAVTTPRATTPSSATSISSTRSPSSNSGQTTTGLSTSPSAITPILSLSSTSTSTSTSSQATPSSTSNEASFGLSGFGGLVPVCICFMVSFLVFA